MIKNRFFCGEMFKVFRHFALALYLAKVLHGLTFKKFFVILLLEKEKKEALQLLLEVFKAIVLIREFCTQHQESCKDCSLRTICGKMPCDW